MPVTDPPFPADFERGWLHGRVDALDARLTVVETTTLGMDAKLDQLLLAASAAVGGRAQMRGLMKAGAFLVTVLAALGSALTWALANLHLTMNK